jgi:hypothetical protein
MLALVGVLLSVIGGLIVHQFALLRGYLDARFGVVDARFEGLATSIDARFDGVNRRLDHLDRDVQALMADRFRREE